MKRALTFSVARLAAIAILGGVALAGCSGGAETKQNDPTTGPTASGSTYSGPAPTTADVQAFRIHFWENVRGTNRCGNCHNAGGQSPNFARSDDVNAAYQQAIAVIDRNDPSQSRIVSKVGGGHNCWLTDANSCATILTRWITDWVGATGTSGRQIQLTAPPSKDPGASRRFPETAPAGFTGVHNLLTQYCSGCHTSTSATKQQPYFASSDIDEAYLAAIPKINLDLPGESRFVIRLGRESHNCWDNCAANAATMQAAIQAMADGIPVTQVDPSLVVSKALRLVDGTVASGGNRYEKNLVALYEFKTGSGSTVFDTSGVDPAADLTIAGQRTVDYDWVGGWGVQFKTALAKAQASTTASRKFHQMITLTGEYSIEAWVVPGNVTQEDRRIVSYSSSKTARNFTMGQTMYNYDFFNRSSETGTNGDPALSTDPDDEVLQATLQHVVMTYDPVNGRRIYVNGEFTGDVDREGGGTLGDWDNSFAFVLGNEVGGNAASETAWNGVLRLVAVHNRALTLEQIRQNFEAGVGEKFFLLFGIEHITSIPRSYILFEAAQYDSAGYLFTNPRFVSLDANARPGSLQLRGMRLGVNGAEPAVGQAYRPLDITITDAGYAPDTGFTLSTVGTVIGLEHGPQQDEFYLCFDQLGSRSNVCSQYASAVPPTFVNTPRPADIGVRTFDAINATLAGVTGVSPNNAAAKATFSNVRQSLPAVVNLEAFLSSHQTSIAQLAITYCSALVDDTTARAAYFPGLNFGGDITTQRAALINPLVTRMIGNAGSQPDATAVQTELDALVTRLCGGGSCASGSRTPTVVKAVCGAAAGNAAMLVR
jgi:hypothetical protein